MRTLVIGDIHSGLKALKQVLQKANITKKDKLIFLGDYVDGWSEAAETVDFLITLNETYNCIFLRGNHDELCFNYLVTEKENKEWLKHGGTATSASYSKLDEDTKNKHLDFYEELESYHLDSENRLFLHAGFTNLKGIEFEFFEKNFYWDRTLWELALATDNRLKENDILFPKRLSLYKEVYIGHTPLTRINKTYPLCASNVWNIDTGAAFKGPLSVMDINTKEVWQSEPVYTFYPDEKGRN